VQQREQLINRLAVVGLIEQAVELCRRGAQSTDDLAPAQPASGDSPLSFERQSVEEPVPEILRVLIVFEHPIDVDRALLSRGEGIAEAFSADFGVDYGPDDRIVRSGPDLELGVRKPMH